MNGIVSKVISDKCRKELDKLYKKQMLQLCEAENFIMGSCFRLKFKIHWGMMISLEVGNDSKRQNCRLSREKLGGKKNEKAVCNAAGCRYGYRHVRWLR